MDDLLNIAVSNALAATVLALVALAVGAIYRRPALLHGLWLLVLLKLVTPPLLFLPVSWPQAGEALPQELITWREEPPIASLPAAEERETDAIFMEDDEVVRFDDEASVELRHSHSPAFSDSLEAPEQLRSLWPRILSIFWGGGAMAWFLLALERVSRFRRLLRFSQPPSAALQKRTLRLAISLGLNRCPRIRLLPGRIAPMLWAIGGPPRLFVPAKLLDLLNDEQLDTLLLHELAHLRRRDHWVRVLEFVVMGLYWWHPVVWYARRELREAEEQCCDAWVVSTLPDAGRTYASALLDTLDFLSPAQAAVPPLASGLSQIADLKRRLTMIMRGNTPRSLTWPGCLAVFSLGMMVLPMLPSLHGQSVADLIVQEDEKTKPEPEDKSTLEAAKAALQRKKAQLEKEKAELKRAEAELRSVERDYQKKMQQDRAKKLQAEKQLQFAFEAKKRAETKESGKQKKAGFRIEISLPGEISVDPKEVVAKLKKILPEELRELIVLRPMEGPQAFTLDWRVEPGKNPPRVIVKPDQPPVVRPVPPVEPTGPSRGRSGAGAPSEKRINDLEKKLEKVLRELQELRSQMKESRSESSAAPSVKKFRVTPLVIDSTKPIGLTIVPATTTPPSPPSPSQDPHEPPTPPEPLPPSSR